MRNLTLMWADSTDRLGEIAVMAKYLKTFRKVISNYPSIGPLRSHSLYYLTPVFRSTAINMVKCEKFKDILAATVAFWYRLAAIMLQNQQPSFSVASSDYFVSLFPVSLAPSHRTNRFPFAELRVGCSAIACIARTAQTLCAISLAKFTTARYAMFVHEKYCTT